jgi:hypothetical protein
MPIHSGIIFPWKAPRVAISEIVQAPSDFGIVVTTYFLVFSLFRQVPHFLHKISSKTPFFTQQFSILSHVVTLTQSKGIIFTFLK